MTQEPKVTSAELIVRCRHQLSNIEELAAKGMNGQQVLLEVARFAGAARLLHWTSEEEYAAARKDQESRDLEHRGQVAGVEQ